MTVLRDYFISDNLDDLEVLEEELERQHVETAQIHVLSLDDSGTENHVHLNDVSSFIKKTLCTRASWVVGRSRRRSSRAA